MAADDLQICQNVGTSLWKCAQLERFGMIKSNKDVKEVKKELQSGSRSVIMAS